MDNFEILGTTELELIDGGLSTGGLLWNMGKTAAGAALTGAGFGGPGGAIAGGIFGACAGAIDYVVSDYLG